MPGLTTEISTLHFIHDNLENVRCKTYLIQTPNQEHSFLEPLAGYILLLSEYYYYLNKLVVVVIARQNSHSKNVFLRIANIYSTMIGRKFRQKVFGTTRCFGLFGTLMPCLVNPKVPLLLCFTLYLRVISKYKPPGAYIRRGDLTEGFSLRYEFGGLIHGGAYFWNFAVYIYLLPKKEGKQLPMFQWYNVKTYKMLAGSRNFCNSICLSFCSTNYPSGKVLYVLQFIDISV